MILMVEDFRIKIEKIFRESNSSEELFDAFQLSINTGIKDLELYKILLANPTLSKDEIIMFTEKLGAEFVEGSYDLYMWTANIFENNISDYEYVENSLLYYQKFAAIKPHKADPLISALKLYNYEIELPANSLIHKMVTNGVKNVNLKSKVYLDFDSCRKKFIKKH